MNSNIKKIAIVTGASGFLGSHTVERLLADGYRVRATDIDETRFNRNLGSVADDPNLSVEICDLFDIEAESSFFAGASYLYHCAGLVDHVPSMKNPEKYLKINVLAVARALEGARYHGYAKVIYPSSAAVYGAAEWPTREDHLIRPSNPYGLSKWMGEELIESWNTIFGVPTLGFRIFNGYGPRAEFGSVINFFLRKKLADEPITITGDGSQRRDFIFATDIVDAFIRGAESNKSGEIYNLGHGKLHTLIDTARLISDDIEFIPSRPNDPEVICPDITKVQKDLDWTPKVKLKDGLRATIEAMKN
jgi:UDP-glucose 4-epimerase